MSLTLAKLLKVHNKITNVLASEKITPCSLHSLIRSVPFISQVATPGRAFVRRLIDLTIKIKKAWHLEHLSKGAKEDLLMCQIFLHNFKERAIIIGC